MKKIILVFALGVVFSGISALATPSSDVLFIVMGGRTSCGSSDPEPTGLAMYANFTGMLKDLKSRLPERNFHFLVSCFNSDAPPDGEALFITSEQPTVTQTGNAEAMRSQIETFAASKEGMTTFVIGHSYGGWLAMYLGQNLKLSRPIDGLFTIDPISPECGPLGYILGAAECHEAPTDLDNATIRKQTKQWTNFYQDQDGWLHSSEIAEADNVHLQYRGQHTQIDVDPRTWSGISDKVKAELQ